MALIVLALGSLLVVPGLNLATTNLNYHQLIEGKTLESYSADSGVQYALCELYNNPNEYAGTLLEASFTINDRAVHVTAEPVGSGIYKIISTATSGSGRSTTIESYVTLSVGVFAFTVAAKDGMIIENSTVDSSPDPGEAHIHSNADILLTNSQINGNATAVGTISGQQCVTGFVTEGSSAVAFPPDYAQLYEAMAKGPNGDNIHVGDYTLADAGTVYLGPLYISGNLYISNTTVILEGTLYVAGEIWVAFGRLEGKVNVLAEVYVNIEGGGFGSVEDIPFITCTNGDIKLEGPVVDAVVYAPNGLVWLEEVYVYGAVGGKTVKVEWSTITYAQQLQGREDVPGGELHTITYSFK